MDKFDFLENTNLIIFLEFRYAYNCGSVSLVDSDLSFTGKFKDLINHLEKYFDYDDIVEMINDADLMLFDTYNDGQDITFDVFDEVHDSLYYDDYEKAYLKVVR